MANGTPTSNTRAEATITSPVEPLLLLAASTDFVSTQNPDAGVKQSPSGLYGNNHEEAEDNQDISDEHSLFLQALPPKNEQLSQRHVRIEMVESPSGSWKTPSVLNPNVADNRPKTAQNSLHSHNSTKEQEPPRQDSAYYSVDNISDDNSELDPDLQAQQVRARARLAILRRRVFRTRNILKDHRDRLRELRQDVREAADKLTRKVSECIALDDTAALQTVLPLHENLRVAQDIVGPEEEEYERLERRLDDEERDLEQEEDHFDRHVDLSTVGLVGSAEIAESKLDEELSPLIKPYHPSDSEVSHLSVTDERLAEYLGKVSEAENLKQELDDLEEDYERLTKDLAFRKRHKVPASKETIQFINIYPQAHEETLEKLYDIEDDIENLREHCLEQKVFTASEYIYTSRSALYEDIMDSVDEARARSPLRTAANDLKYPEAEVDFSDKRDYINKWLLKWVQESVFETLLLRSYIVQAFSSQSTYLAEDKWPKLALESWDVDHAGEHTNQAFTESRMDMILGDPRNIETPSTAQRTGFLGILTDIGSLEIESSSVEHSLLSTQSLTSELTTANHRSRSAPASIWRVGSIL